MTLFVECPFCHKRVLKWFFAAHQAKHTRRGVDGQMQDHINEREEDRYSGSLDGVPMWYRHEVCGKTTGMPEDIVRSYLANPFLYTSRTFCSGCRDYVHMSECFWRETGESVIAYRRNLMRKVLANKDLVRVSFRTIQEIKAWMHARGALDSPLRITLKREGESIGITGLFHSRFDPECDWQGDYNGLKVLVNLDEVARYVHDRELIFHSDQLALQ